MKTSLALMCGVLMMSSVVFAEDTVETCANGAGTIVTGAVTGYKYCRSNSNDMNWWNAVSWCDAMGRKLFDRANCACGNTTADCAGSICPELKGVGSGDWVWTITRSPDIDIRSYRVLLDTGYSNGGHLSKDLHHALCK